MSRCVRRSVLALVAVVLLLPTGGRAAAAPGSGGGTGAAGNSSGGTITAVVSITTGGGGSGGGSCRWERVNGELGAPELGSVTYPFTDGGVTFHLWKKSCPSGTTWHVVPETEPGDLVPGLLQELKERSLPSPEPSLLALDPLHGWAYVTVPVDFRAGGDSWRTVSVTASVGPVWARVTAVPARLTFDPGDPNGPGPVSCSGDAPTADFDPAVPGACSYTYRNASSTSPFDGYHFQTTTSIDWSISWTSSTGAGAQLASYSTSASALLAVAEVKGLVTCTGARAEQGGC